MDPNTVLDIIRHELKGEGSAAEEAFHDLDEWLSKGGFLPSDWQR